MNVEASPGRAGGRSAAGPAGGDTAYRTQSLKFLPVETGLDESVSLRALFELWVRAAAVAWSVFGILFVIWVVGSAGAVAALGSGDSDAISVVSVGLLITAIVIPFLLFWFLLLVPQTEEPVAEWRALLENRAFEATSAYAAIYGSLVRRRIPVNAAALRVRSDVLGGDVVNNRLLVSEGGYRASVTVFPYGMCLYVGWSMYRNRRGAVLVGTFLKDLVRSLVGRTGPVNRMLRTEKVRALREALHSAVREGVDVAVQGIQMPLAATFGHDVPVQNLDGTGVATPAPFPAPVPAPHPAAPQSGAGAPIPSQAPPRQGRSTFGSREQGAQ